MSIFVYAIGAWNFLLDEFHLEQFVKKSGSDMKPHLIFQLSYFLGLILFPNNVEMQLGLFFTGVSPSGGASNIWSVILGGNLDLSISMTTISTFSAFGK